MRGVMALNEWGCGLPLLMIKVLVLSLLLHGAAPFHDTVYSRDSLQAVVDIPVEGRTRLCVVPLDNNTRLKVRHTDAQGGRQEVTLRKKSLVPSTLTMLEIEVTAGDDDKPSLSVQPLNKPVQPTDILAPISPGPSLPHTTLLLKGKARIMDCAPQQGSSKIQAVTDGYRGEATEGLRGGGEKVTQRQGEKVTREQVTQVPSGRVTTEGQEEVTQELQVKVTQDQGEKLTLGTKGNSTLAQGSMLTDGQGEEEVVSSGASSPSPASSASTNATLETEDPESDDEETWWSFLLVLGKVGEVPLLLVLVGCLLVGVMVGSVMVCACSKVCRKRRVEYLPVSTQRTHSGHLAGDIVRDTKFWDSLSSRQRSSGIGSDYSTLNTDKGSQVGTTNSRGTGSRLGGSPNSSLDRSNTQVPPHIGVNNLSRGLNGSPNGSTRSRNNSSGNVLNIPQGGGITRSSSSRSTGSSDNRDMERSPMLAKGGSVSRTTSNRSNASSFNRNTNRSPNIPYNNKLATLTGHQDTAVLNKPQNRHHDLDDDSDDSSYDKPYISPPIVADNYSVPVIIEMRNTTAATSDPAARQVPVYHFETFKK